MKRFFLFVIPLLAFSLSGVTSANAAPFPANNENACDMVNGVYVQTGSGNSETSTCTVGGGSETTATMTAGQSGRAFTLVVVSAGTVYTKDQGKTSTEDILASTTCYNPGGNEVSTDIPPCQLP